VLAEDIYDVLPLDTRRGTGLGAVAVEQFGQGVAPLIPLCPGNKSGDVVRRRQVGWLRSRWPWMVYRGSARGKGLGAENGIFGRFDRQAVDTLDNWPATQLENPTFSTQ
jgi:hypothetical protein